MVQNCLWSENMLAKHVWRNFTKPILHSTWPSAVLKVLSSISLRWLLVLDNRWLCLCSIMMFFSSFLMAYMTLSMNFYVRNPYVHKLFQGKATRYRNLEKNENKRMMKCVSCSFHLLLWFKKKHRFLKIS